MRLAPKTESVTEILKRVAVFWDPGERCGSGDRLRGGPVEGCFARADQLKGRDENDHMESVKRR